MRILKYELEITDRQHIHIGNNFIVPLSVAEQNGKLMMWAMVKESEFPEIKNVTVRIDILGTGQEVGESDLGSANFIGTVVKSNGHVWHVFARILDVK